MRASTAAAEPAGLAGHLKAATAASHHRLDAAIAAARPFESRARYARFLAVQFAFHRAVDPLYADPDLAALLPDLAGRRRLPAVAADLADLGAPPPAGEAAPLFAPALPADRAAAAGALYVAEGSRLGAAFLLAAVAGLGLSERFGARHLAGHPDGRARHWRRFTEALDGLALGADEEARAAVAAEAAFAHVEGLVARWFAA
ncbi:biliverdin-producing heme oxygenase [Prosthecomicrobium pneumaticum]|uniref:Heme oxygenase n=1 Tax=Prosthecomicrobium pneumaticum TaxID=81895 RepID=A0A7W9FQG9_9HYPH|nr:biliverdin-producing heme oxygenase [Prosthecomicrobium pneumaticum]MBB5754886.1 heme oxygenase [Prosthecomicrobium pneumaticum]